MLDLDAIRQRDAALGPLESAEVRAPSAMAELDRRALLGLVDELHAWQRAMVEKAAAKSLDGYRELGQKAAKAENRAEYWKAEHQAANREIDRLTTDRQALQEKATKAERDASRYQWLRNSAHPDNGEGVCAAAWETSASGKHYFKHYHGARLDHVLDEALGFELATVPGTPLCTACADAGCGECHSCNSPGCSICTEPNTKSQEMSDGR